MDLGEIRRRQLRRICDGAPFKGSQRKLADAIARAPNLISRMMGGSKGIGEQMARHIEDCLGLPRYSLDRSEDGEAPGASKTKRQMMPLTVALLVEQMRGPLTPLGIRLEDVVDVRELSRKLEIALYGPPPLKKTTSAESTKPATAKPGAR